MTAEEAISVIETISKIQDDYFISEIMGTWYKEIAVDFHDALTVAVDALKKQIPVKPKRIDKNAEFDGNWKKVCPVCGRVLVERITKPEESYPIYYNMTDHCICGQAIYWSENECKKSRGRRWG